MVFDLLILALMLVGHWALAFPALMLLGGGIYHWSWCRKYGIDPLTAEPREKFEALVHQQYHLPQPS